MGFRAPTGELSVHTLGHLAELGFAYDASFQDSDFPYTVQLANNRTIVEIPATYALEDAPVYSARHTHERLVRIFRDEISAMREAETPIPITLHLRGDVGSTRGARIAALDGLLTEIKAYGDVHFMTGESYRCAREVAWAHGRTGPGYSSPAYPVEDGLSRRSRGQAAGLKLCDARECVASRVTC